MRTASELKTAGRKDLEGRWNEAALLSFVYGLISFILTGAAQGCLWLASGTTSGGSVISILLIPMSWSVCMTYLANHRHEDNDPFDIGHLGDGYRDFSRIFLTILLESVYIILWTLLLIIPGIIKSLSYAMTPYILRDYPELKNNGAIELSMKMMQGHKVDLFWLYLTFIGWAIACLFTLGIGCLWLEPYMQASVTNFYEEVKAEYEGRPVTAEPEQPTDNYQK